MYSMSKNEWKLTVQDKEGKQRKETPSDRRARQKRIARFRRGK